MKSIKGIFSVAAYNFRQWKGSPRIVITFGLAFVLCYLLSNKAVAFAAENGTTMQILEAFIWTFGDSNSILLSSMLLVLLFADMLFLSPGTPFYLMRLNRRTWLTGQAVYIVLATGIYLAFILAATSILCMRDSFIGDMWSMTAAILGYSGAGQAVALPAYVKTLEMSTPYPVTATIFLLMMLYTLLMVFIMLVFNIKKGQIAGVVSVFAYSLFGFVLDPKTIGSMLQLPDSLMYKVNVAIGWVSPLNNATYQMHNFGYDLLPRLWQTYLIFGAAIIFCFLFTLRGIKKYSFQFSGTEQ